MSLKFGDGEEDLERQTVKMHIEEEKKKVERLRRGEERGEKMQRKDRKYKKESS